MSAYGNPVNVSLEEKRKFLMTLGAIAIATLMVFPIVTHLNLNSAVQPVIYTYRSETVEFNGMHAYIGFGENLYPVSWTVFQIEPSGKVSSTSTVSRATTSYITVPVNFSDYRTNRIVGPDQNSAVLVMWNSNVRIAEIYSFTLNGIDASLAITNFNSTSQVFITTFAIQQRFDPYSWTSGFEHAGIQHGAGVGNSIYSILGSTWQIEQGNLSISWLNEQSIFRGGLLYSGINREITSLPFGPLKLSPNETYSVDPVISPDQSTPPTNGGGGGGGSPPTITDVSLSNFTVTHAKGGGAVETDTVIGGDRMLQFSVQYNVTSGTTANLYFAGTSPTSSGFPLKSFSVSGEGTETLTWAAVPGYYTGFTVGSGANTLIFGNIPGFAGNVYIRTTSPFVSGNITYFPPDSIGFGHLYESAGGKLIGNVTQSTGGQNDTIEGGGWNSIVQSSSTVPLSFSVSLFNQTQMLGVYSLSQEFKFTGNSMGTSPQSTVGSAFTALTAYENDVQGTWGPQNSTEIEQTMWNAIEFSLGIATLTPELNPEYLIIIGAVSGLMALIGPMIFSTQNTFSVTENDRIWDNLTGDRYTSSPFYVPYTIYDVLQQYGNVTYPVYGDVYYGPDQVPAHLFNFDEYLELGGISGYSYVLNYFMYTANITTIPLNQSNNYEIEYVGNADWNAPTYSTSISLPLYMAEGT